LVKQVGELLLHSVHPAIGFVHVGFVTLVPFSCPPHYPFAVAVESRIMFRYPELVVVVYPSPNKGF